MKNRRKGRIPSILEILKAAVRPLTASEITAAYNEMHYGDDFAVERETILAALVGYIRRHPEGEILQRGNEFQYQGLPRIPAVSIRKGGLQWPTKVDAVNHPRHYGGEDNPYEAIKVIEAWELGFNLGNTVKYISRAGLKHAQDIEDLEKAAWYLNREIQRRKTATAAAEAQA